MVAGAKSTRKPIGYLYYYCVVFFLWFFKSVFDIKQNSFIIFEFSFHSKVMEIDSSTKDFHQFGAIFPHVEKID